MTDLRKKAAMKTPNRSMNIKRGKLWCQSHNCLASKCNNKKDAHMYIGITFVTWDNPKRRKNEA